MAAIPTFPEFDTLDQSNLAIRWEKYLMRFNNLITAMDIKDDSRKRALLLHYIGEGANDIFYTTHMDRFLGPNSLDGTSF